MSEKRINSGPKAQTDKGVLTTLKVILPTAEANEMEFIHQMHILCQLAKTYC